MSENLDEKSAEQLKKENEELLAAQTEQDKKDKIIAAQKVEDDKKAFKTAVQAKVDETMNLGNKDVEQLEKEYKDLLASNLVDLKIERDEKDKIIAAQKVEDDKATFEAAVEVKVNAMLEKMHVTPNGDDDMDNSGDDNTNGNDAVKLPRFLTSQFKASGIERYAPYDNEDFMEAYIEQGKDVFSATTCDDDCNDVVTDWENADYFADGIWLEIIAKSDFLGRVGHRKINYKLGSAAQAQIKLINIPDPSMDWKALSSTTTPCEPLTCTTNAFTTYTVTLQKYGDFKILCDEDFITAGNEIKSAVIMAMRATLQDKIDTAIYTNLSGAASTYTEGLAAVIGTSSLQTDGKCCTYTVDLYKAIIDLEAAMRTAGYFQVKNPVLIVSPTVAAFLKYKDGLNIPAYIASQIKMDGTKLTGIGQIQVIESAHANAASAVTDAVMGILLDPDRAFAEMWGKKPTFEYDRDISCGSNEIVVWAYASFDVLDVGAIGHIVNPSS